MYRATPETIPKLFADDTNIFIVDDNLDALTLKVNSCLSKIYQWCLANKLSINLEKTNFTVFSPNRNVNTDNIVINIGNFKINHTDCCKYLGILLTIS